MPEGKPGVRRGSGYEPAAAVINRPANLLKGTSTAAAAAAGRPPRRTGSHGRSESLGPAAALDTMCATRYRVLSLEPRVLDPEGINF